MAKAKTATFFIRRKLDIAATTAATLTIDTSAYVDPADRQGLMIEEVDYIFFDSSNKLPYETTTRQYAVQLLAGGFSELQDYDNEDLISSGGMVMSSTYQPSKDADVYPDALATPGGRILVDDQMTLVGKSSDTSANMTVAVLIKAKVVSLSNKDYMALALQTVAN